MNADLTLPDETPEDGDRRRAIERMAREMNEQLAPAVEGPITRLRPGRKPRIVHGDDAR